MANITTQHRLAPALFSTNLGEFAPRPASEPLPPVILHSNIQEDKVRFASALREKYPIQCGAIPPAFVLEDYFDAYDIHLQTPVYLALVLQELLAQNIIRASKVHDFAVKWFHANQNKLASFGSDLGDPQDVFSAQEHEQFGAEFLKDALVVLKVQTTRSLIVNPFDTNGKNDSGPDTRMGYSGENPMSAEFARASARYPIPSSDYVSMVQAHRYSSAPDLGNREGPTDPNRPSLMRYQSVQNGYPPLESELYTGGANPVSYGFAEDSSFFQQDPYHASLGKPYMAVGESLRPVHPTTGNHNLQATNHAQQGTFLPPEYFSPRDMSLVSHTGGSLSRGYSHNRVGPTSAAARAPPLPTPRGMVDQNSHASLSAGNRGDARNLMNETAKEIANVPRVNFDRGRNVGVFVGGNNPISSEVQPADLNGRSSRPYHAQYPPDLSAPPPGSRSHIMFYPQVHGVQPWQVRMDSPDRGVKARVPQNSDRQDRAYNERLTNIETTNTSQNNQRRKPVIPSTGSDLSSNQALHTRPSNYSLANTPNGNRNNKTSPTKHRKDRIPTPKDNAPITRVNSHSDQLHAEKRCFQGMGQVLANPLHHQYQNDAAFVTQDKYPHILNELAEAASESGCKLYVGNLPLRLAEHSLRDAFSRYGRIENITLKECTYHNPLNPPNTVKFAFIHFCTPQEACQALENMDGYILDGRSLRVNFARPPKYYQDRFPSFNARRAAQNRAEGSISANNTSSASPQQRLNVTTKGSINHRKMDATLPRLPGADTHSYHSPTESRPTGINVTERNRNTSVPDTGEPPGDRFHNRPGVVPDLRHPYAHFFPTASISDLDHNERSLHATEARLDQNSSALSRYPKDPLSVMPEDILERLGSKYEAEVARAYSRPSGRQEHFIGGEQLTHAGQIGGEDNPNAFSSAEDRYNYGHGSMIGLRQSTDRSALFSPQDARSDLSGHPLNSTSNAAGQGSAEAFAPSQAVGGDFGTVQGVRNEFEGPLLEQSQKKLSAPCHDDDGAIQTPEVDQKASARPHNRASPEKHKVRRNKSSNNSSPTKAVAYSKARSRETSDSGVIDTHTELSHSSKNRGFSKEPPQPGHQPSIAHKEAFQETPINSSPTFAVVNSGASKVDNGDVVATHSSGRASSASEIREPVQIVAKPNSRPGSARGQALESSEHSHLKAVTPSAGKTKKVPKGKKKTVAMTGDKPLGTQSAKLVQQSTAKNNPRTMPQLSTEYSASQGVPSGSGSAVIPKHDSATNMPETTIEATGNISLEETILRSSPRGRTQGGPGYDVQNSGEPTVAGPVPRIRSAASSPTQRLDRVASAQLDQSNSSNAKTIKDNVSNRIKSHSVNPLDTVLVEQSIGEKEVLKSEEPQRLSGSTSKARKMATGQPRAKQATAEINQKRAVPKSRSTSRTKKNTEEAGATRASICTAPDLNSRSVFPDLGVILDKAKCEGTEDTTPAKLSRSLQARKPNKPTQNVHAQILNHGNHDQCITPLDDKAEGAQPLRHQSSVSGDVIEPKETQLSIEEAHDKHVSDANEDGVSEAQPAKPRSWSEVVGLSTLSSQSQKQAATESEVAPPTVSDPWAIDEGTSAWAGKSINTDNTTVQSHGRNHAPQGKKVTKSENAKRDTPGSASTKKENVNTLKKKSKDASSQVPAGKRKGSQKEQVSAGDGMVDP